MVPTWYVTYEVPRPGIPSKQWRPRETSTFETEQEAKQFARAKLDEGIAVFAGTINPHVPRRVIAASGINAWIGDES